MIDIYDLGQGDVIFKNHGSTRIENLLKRRGTYAYFEEIGFDFDFYIKSNLIFSLESFKVSLTTALSQQKVSFKTVNAQKIGKGIASLKIQIDV